MNAAVIYTQNEMDGTIRYEMDAENSYFYQRNRAMILLRDHLWGIQADVSSGMTYVLRPEETLGALFSAEPRVKEILRCLSDFRELIEQTEDALLDPDRWIWDPDHWTWDSTSGMIRGVYVPDKRFSMDPAAFFGQWSRLLMQKSISQEWSDDTLILFLHRFCCAASKMEKGEMTLSQYLRTENIQDMPQTVFEDPLLQQDLYVPLASSGQERSGQTALTVTKPGLIQRISQTFRSRPKQGQGGIPLPFR